MATIELEKLSVKELKALRKDVENAIIDNEKRLKQEALASAQAAVAEFGYSLEELLGGTSKKVGRGTLNPPKYRHPENPAITWTGRGRHPAWFKEALEAGYPLEDFLIEK